MSPWTSPTGDETTTKVENVDIPNIINLDELGTYLGFRWFHVRMIVSVSIFLLVPAIFVGPVPYIVEDVKTTYGATDAQVALISSGAVWGGCVGVLLSGTLCDQLGRQKIISVCIFLVGLGSVLHYMLPVSWPFNWLLLIRFVFGLPYGGLCVYLTPYMMEFFADQHRGWACSIINLAWPLGSVLSIQLAHELLGKHKLCLASPIVPCILSLGALAFCPESPRWLLMVGQKERAQKVLEQIFASRPVFGSGHLGGAPEVYCDEVDDVTVSFEDALRRHEELFEPELRYVTILATVLYCSTSASQVTWVWGPQILAKIVGGDLPHTVYTWTEVSGVLATVAASALLDRTGRRSMMAFSFFIGAFVCIVLSFAPTTGVVIALWLCLGIMNGTLWTSISVYLSEAFPTMLRCTGNGFTGFLQRIAQGVVPMILGLFISRSVTAVLLITAAIFAFGALLCGFIPKETAGEAIEDATPRTVRRWSVSARERPVGKNSNMRISKSARV